MREVIECPQRAVPLWVCFDGVWPCHFRVGLVRCGVRDGSISLLYLRGGHLLGGLVHHLVTLNAHMGFDFPDIGVESCLCSLFSYVEDGFQQLPVPCQSHDQGVIQCLVEDLEGPQAVSVEGDILPCNGGVLERHVDGTELGSVVGVCSLSSSWVHMNNLGGSFRHSNAVGCSNRVGSPLFDAAAIRVDLGSVVPAEGESVSPPDWLGRGSPGDRGWGCAVCRWEVLVGLWWLEDIVAQVRQSGFLRHSQGVGVCSLYFF